MTTTLITGANKSLGYETARRLIEAGHTVWMAARDPERGRQAADALGGRFVQLDVTNDESVAAALLSPDGVVLSVNELYRELFPLSADLMPGQRWPDLLPPDMAPAAHRLLAELSSGAVDRILASAQPRPRWFRMCGAQAVQAGTTLPVLVLQVDELTGSGTDPRALLGQLIR